MTQLLPFLRSLRFTLPKWTGILVLLGLLSIAIAQAQSWHTFTPANSGLQSGVVTGMTIDPQNNLWVGYGEAVYGTPQPPTPSIPISKFSSGNWTHFSHFQRGIDYDVNDIVILGNGEKWLATEYGLQKWDASGFTHYLCPTYNALTYALDTSANGDFWAAGNGVWKFDGTNWTEYNTSNSGLSNNLVVELEADGNIIWAGTYSGLDKFDGTTWTNYSASNTPLTNSIIRGIQEDGSGGVWVITGSELAHLSSGGSWTIYNSFNSGLPTNFLRDMELDGAGNLWVSSIDGLVKFDGTNWTVWDTSNSGIADDVLFNLQVIGSDVYVYCSGGVLQKFDGTTFTTISNTITRIPRNVAVDHNGQFWSAHDNEGLQNVNGSAVSVYTYESTNLNQGPTGAMATGVGSNIWNANAFGLHKFDGANWTTYKNNNSNLDNDVLSLVATNGNGAIWVVDNTQKKLTHFDGTNATTYTDANSPLTYTTIRQIEVDPAGAVWMAHYPGLMKYDGSNWTQYTQTNSNINSNYVYAFHIDEQGVIWLVSKPSSTVLVQKFDGTTWTSYPALPAAAGSPYDIDFGNQTGLWVATSTGTYEYNGTSWNLYNTQNTTMTTDSVSFITHDSTGNLWLGQTSGLTVYGAVIPVDLGNDTLLCPGDSLLLSIGSGFSNILWSTGATSDSIWVYGSGQYYVTATNSAGFTSSDTINISSGNAGPLNINLGNDTAICQNGVPLTLDAGAWPDASYLWNTSSTTQSITITSSGLYSVFVIDACGNIGQDSILVGLSEPSVTILDSLAFQNPALPRDTLFCEDTLITTTHPNPQTGNWSLLWSNGSTQYGIEITQSGQYSVIFDDGFGCQAFDTINVTVDTSCVWPGDANSDNIANNVDVLALGVAFNNIGSPRVAPHNNNSWYAHPVADWSTFFANGINQKHADCDGNGLVSQADLNVISQNYGLTHNKIFGLNAGPNDPALYFYNLQDSVQAGDTLDIIVGLGRDTLIADSVYGIAFTMHYDPDLVDTNSLVVNYDSSWLGTSGTDLIHLDMDFWANGNVQIGMARNDQQNVSGYGRIVSIGVVVQDDIAGKNLVTEDLLLGFSAVTLINVGEQLIPVNLDSGKVVVYEEEETGISENEWVAVDLYPNPTTGRVFIHHPGFDPELWQVLNLQGQEMLKVDAGLSGRTELDLGSLAAGIYFLRGESGSGRVMRKIVKQ